MKFLYIQKKLLVPECRAIIEKPGAQAPSPASHQILHRAEGGCGPHLFRINSFAPR
jgi:hypothetical protein